jgi:hypothetical protein
LPDDGRRDLKSLADHDAAGEICLEKCAGVLAWQSTIAYESAPERDWSRGRVVEGARLESVYTGNRIEGSNPSDSAIQFMLFVGFSPS